MSDRPLADFPAYSELVGELREIEVLGSVGGLLSWDQETKMPPAAAPLRAEQSAMLSAVVHERRTSRRLADLLARCEADGEILADPRRAANLREIRREYDHAVRLPVSLVREIAQTNSLALQAWREAREASDFSLLAPWLEKVVGLARTKAEHLMNEDTADPYDALLEEYEPGARAERIAAVFADLRARLAPLIAAVAASGRRPSTRMHEIAVPLARQEELNRLVAERLGFDFDAGRIDVSTHPFCQGIGPGDTRLTTRYRPTHFADALSSTMHEAGHGLYEQGLPKEQYLGQPLADAASLGVHESQSRMWENFVGRSRAFWVWALPEARRILGEGLDGIGVDEAYAAMNVVEPGLIRVDSDEATYNLHIMLRFDLERAMLRGDLAVADVPAAWNDRVRADLGLEVPDDRSGCLQDIHWAMGGIGYFPTYTLGNLYAAQFWTAINRDLPELDASMAEGDFGGLLGWLRANIHSRGRELPAMELCEGITGRPLEAAPFVEYLEAKLRPIYGL